MQNISSNLLLHYSPNIRISALYLIVHPSNSANPFPEFVLESLQRCIPHFHQETSPKTRNEFLAIMKRLCIRLERVLYALSEADNFENLIPSLKGETSWSPRVETNVTRHLSQKHIAFSSWYIEFLISELQPLRSYGGHITALKQLSYVFGVKNYKPSFPRLLIIATSIENVRKPAHEYVFPFGYSRLLVDLVMDPFDDVRTAAFDILQTILWDGMPGNGFSAHVKSMVSIGPGSGDSLRSRRHCCDDFVLPVLSRAKNLLSCTGRADHADGVGKLYYLLYSCSRDFDQSEGIHKSLLVLEDILLSLSSDIKTARDNIYSAVGHAPLHGSLIALR